jgi:isoamylase
LDLTRRLIELRKASPVLRQRAFFEGHAVADGDGCKDLAWFHPNGNELNEGNWFDRGLRTVGMYLDGRGLRERGPRGELIIDDSYLVIFHSGDDGIEFTLPARPWADHYEVVIDSTEPGGTEAGDNEASSAEVRGGDTITVEQRSVLVLRVNRV